MKALHTYQVLDTLVADYFDQHILTPDFHFGYPDTNLFLLASYMSLHPIETRNIDLPDRKQHIRRWFYSESKIIYFRSLSYL